MADALRAYAQRTAKSKYMDIRENPLAYVGQPTDRICDETLVYVDGFNPVIGLDVQLQ